MRRKGVNSIKDIISKLMNSPKAKEKLVEIEVINHLEDILGDKLNQYITKKYFNDGDIHLYLSSSVLRSELSYQKEELILRINKSLGSELVRNIVLK